jgi:RNA polymerase sigma factor (sigma-70 family)
MAPDTHHYGFVERHSLESTSPKKLLLLPLLSPSFADPWILMRTVQWKIPRTSGASGGCYPGTRTTGVNSTPFTDPRVTPPWNPEGITVSTPSSRPSSHDRFHTTRWSIVLGVAEKQDPAEAARALDSLCRTYWSPLYAWLRRTGYSSVDAEDIVQGFFTSLLQRRDLERVEPEKGRFRSFLLASLKHFVSNVRDHESARKRGGGRQVVSLEVATAERRLHREPADHQTPEMIFDRQWAWTLLDQVQAGLRTEYVAAGKEELFENLRMYLTGEPSAPRHAEVARTLGMTQPAVKMSVSRLRRRFRERLREEIAQTVASEAEIDDEICVLIEALRA